MHFFKYIDQFSSRRVLAIIFAISVLATITGLFSATSQTHELELVGTGWFGQDKIPLLQSYSTAATLMIYFGYLYSLIASTWLLTAMLDIAILGITSLLSYLMLKRLLPSPKTKQLIVAFIPFFLALLTPGVWPIGLSTAKTGLLFSLLCVYLYIMWRESGESYWLMGKTTKNWRYLLLFGVAFSILIFTNPLLSIIALPLAVDFVRQIESTSARLSWIALAISPIIIHSWIWYSYFSSRKLLGTALSAVTEGLNAQLFSGIPKNLSFFAILPLTLIGVFLIYGASAHNFRKHRSIWITCVSIILLTFVAPSLIIENILVVSMVAGMCYVKIANSLSIAKYLIVIAGLGAFLSVPYHIEFHKISRIEESEIRLVSAYIEQRLESEQRTVYYYGKGAGFYNISGLQNSTRFYDARLLDKPDHLDKFRGDNEAESPKFIVIASSDELKLDPPSRLQEYFDKHYEENTQIEEFVILKRKQSL